MSTDTILVEGSGHETDAKLDTWLRDLMVVTPGCQPRVRKRMLILACREFFEQSGAWRTTIGPKNLQANKKRYYMSPYDAYANVVHVYDVEFKGRPLKAMGRRPPGEEPPAGTPRGYWMETPDTVRLWPQSDVSVEAALTFHVALTPKLTVKHLPMVAATHFYDAIFDGAAGRLMSEPAKPYTNPLQADYHLKRFRGAIGKYSALAKQNFSGAPTWAFPRFGK